MSIEGTKITSLPSAGAAENGDILVIVRSGTNYQITRDSLVSFTEAPLYNLAATTAPTINDDSGDGYTVGSEWLDNVTGLLWQCNSATVGAAEWQPVGMPKPGIRTSLWYTTYQGQHVTASALPASSTIYVYPFLLPQKVQINRIGMRNVSGAGNVKAAIYRSDWDTTSISYGRPIGAPVAVCNTSTAVAPGEVSLALAAPVALYPNVYWFAMKSDGTPTFNSISFTDYSTQSMIGRATLGSNASVTALSISPITYSDAMPTLTSGASWTEVLASGIPIMAYGT